MFKVLVDGCEPTRGSTYSACVDLVASEDVIIGAGETKLIGLGVCIDLNPMFENEKKNLSDLTFEEFESRKNIFMQSHYLQLMLRSSLGKKGLILPNGVGIIDMDYRDEIKMIIHNPLQQYAIKENGVNRGYTKITSWFKINKGDRIGQITLLEHKYYLFGIDSKAKRTGGFGSTDKKDTHV